MSEEIRDEAALEACVGKTSAAIHMKVIDHLDGGALRWLETSPLAVLAFGLPGAGLTITLAGGAPGFAGAANPQHLSLPLTALDDTDSAKVNWGFGALFFSPGLGETLRVNGRVLGVENGVLTVAVEECYVHCAKALIRSGFWEGRGDLPDAGAPFAALVASPFMVLATMHQAGAVDVSPKGDPAGLLLQGDDSGIWFADRPGNRRMDSFRNILTQPQIAVLALFPGHTRSVGFSGPARITTDRDQRERFTVRDKLPKLAICVDTQSTALTVSKALAQASLWPVVAPAERIDPAVMFSNHVRLNKRRGLLATIARVATSPGMMKQGLKRDYKQNLY